ncbi:T9SS type A sorting domain-containing protein [Neolewinella lacunae]|uniref:T9SS type A sorting domain-containing protein n=1 Tax=Neolewinella lacunae TaxID=1517758 RepID=A0A923PRQ0_9BACT|nr:T9SS type A sorting domain-containing protein [Neolewinella lacunae]MBC6996243.1 T9SS type A sorting domain-containing protein [Neolewinella lacunae]MDN3636866.1 T9SS type A sorting domain-containing protein [Neolewinella lacunae]
MIDKLIKSLVIFLAVFTGIPLCAQAQDSILVTIPFYFEDGVGNRDTVIIIISDHQNDSTNLALSSENTIAVPFDSVFEVRASDFFSLSVREMPRFTYKRQAIWREYLGQDPSNCGNWVMDDFISFAMKVKYPPLKVSWDPAAFAVGSRFNCMAESAWIINSMAPNTLWQWWYLTFEGFVDYQCMATDSVKVFYPYIQGGGLGDRFFYSYTLLPIEGSPNPVDTIELINVYLYRPGFEPCFTRVDTDSPEPLGVAPLVYPNPAGSVLYWRAAENERVRTFSVYSVTGQRMQVVALANGGLDVSRLPAGAYFLRLDYADGRAAVSKFLKR